MNDYKVGDIIEWCDETYEILETYGSSGKVKDVAGDIINNFNFNFGGEKAIIKTSANLKSTDNNSQHTKTLHAVQDRNLGAAVMEQLGKDKIVDAPRGSQNLNSTTEVEDGNM